MKDLFTGKQFQYCPVSSIAYYALQNNIVNALLATWYNYIHELGWEKSRLPKESKYGTGIRANRPHQAWHADLAPVNQIYKVPTDR
jgi:hypothetical protein